MFRKTRLAIWILLTGLVLGFTLPPLAAQTDKPPVAQDGPYKIGAKFMQLTDESRDNRELDAFVWYPAIVSKELKPPYAPDTSGAPYPLVIYSHGYTGDPNEAIRLLINRLVSQGFVVAGVNHLDGNDVGLALVNRPLDILFLLNQLADLKDNPLTGIIDTDHVGLVGYSAGTYTSLVAGGARVDLSHLPEWCATNPVKSDADYCNWVLPTWDNMLAYHDQLITPSDSSLWTATTDDRIKALMTLAPCFGQFIGEAGLAEVTLPTLMIAGTSDATCPVEIDANYMYQSLGSSARYLLTLQNRTHGTVLDNALVSQYASAFFGLYLQDKTDYAQYLTPESAAEFRNTTLESQIAKS